MKTKRKETPAAKYKRLMRKWATQRATTAEILYCMDQQRARRFAAEQAAA